MGSIDGEELSQWDAQGSNTHEEKIFVSVRLRPLNEREIAKNDESDWECINTTTILFKKTLPERSMFPAAYTFDRVFGSDCSTKQVYEEGAKKVALSVISGINSSIFAYGQTSSGKTYTMCGITECTVADIYEYIHMHNEREFVLKFSAMEIYNESVRDLLSSDSTPLRLLDDPERGTVVEKLTEVTLRDWSHLKELLSVCEAERQIGETTLNEMSSRSHQILRLTVESSAREFLGAENSSTLAATVNFVDLAGSERASQTLSAGARLKEGSHINRSLLTLGTVIRKLSKGRNAHIPYRDSKLTRILQNYLGGNARTAIICTMSPAHSHVEQSRNTLLFAICAKEVNTNAQVNVVMSEKALVKQLQRELARLESELRSSGPISGTRDSASLLEEKELLIEKMDKEIRELTQQRDLALSRVEDLLRSAGHNQFSSPPIEPEPHEPQLPENSEDQFLSDATSPRIFMNKYFGPDPCQGWEKISRKTDEDSEDNCKEVRCIEMESSLDRHMKERGDKGVGHIRKDPSYEALKKKIQDMRTTIDYLVGPYLVEPSPCSSDTDVFDTRSINLSRSRSCRAILTTVSSSPSFEKADQNESTPPNGFERDSQTSVMSVSMEEKEVDIKTSDDGDAGSLHSFAVGVNEVVEPKSEMQYDDTVQESAGDTNECLDEVHDSLESPSNWPLEFEKQRREIIELWEACNIPLVHRTYFFLLFKGDPSDSVYMEVELRQLSFLKHTLSRGTKTGKYGQILTPSSGVRSLNREREMLSKQMLKRFSAKEREALYQKWGINLDTKQRRLQLSRRLWTGTKDMDHVKESAGLVAKLVGFAEPGQAPKEMFGLCFSPQPMNFRSFSWKHSMSSLK